MPGGCSSAATRFEAARVRAADDAELAREAQGYLDTLRRAQRVAAETERENHAIDAYNAGVAAGNARRYAEAEAAFRRAAALSGRPEFQRQALRLATRMHQQQDGERAFALARAGQVGEAIAIFEGMDRASMSAEDRKWLDENLARLRAHPR
jgi:tetratricopeptide (TPR) repeat protein